MEIFTPHKARIIHEGHHWQYIKPSSLFFVFFTLWRKFYLFVYVFKVEMTNAHALVCLSELIACIELALSWEPAVGPVPKASEDQIIAPLRMNFLEAKVILAKFEIKSFCKQIHLVCTEKYPQFDKTQGDKNKTDLGVSVNNSRHPGQNVSGDTVRRCRLIRDPGARNFWRTHLDPVLSLNCTLHLVIFWSL